MQKNFLAKFTTILDAPIEKVWSALTQPNLLKQYFFGTELECSWIPSEPIYFKGQWEGKPYTDKGIVLEYVPHSHLSYSYLSSWSNMDDSPENYLWIEYRLKDLGNQTELIISQTNYDQERAEHSVKNWEYIISEMKKIL